MQYGFIGENVESIGCVIWSSVFAGCVFQVQVYAAVRCFKSFDFFKYLYFFCIITNNFDTTIIDFLFSMGLKKPQKYLVAFQKTLDIHIMIGSFDLFGINCIHLAFPRFMIIYDTAILI